MIPNSMSSQADYMSSLPGWSFSAAVSVVASAFAAAPENPPKPFSPPKVEADPKTGVELVSYIL